MASKVAFQYGILTGPRVAKRFSQLLTEQGYRVVTDPMEADILICHSAGCFTVPRLDSTQKLLLINPPYWPGRSLGERGRSRVRSFTALYFKKHEISLNNWVWRIWWGAFYGITQLRQERALAKQASMFDLQTALVSQPAVIIRNSDDDWLTPDLDAITATHPNVTIIRLPGDHDNCWVNPEPYVSALKKLR